MRAILTLLTIFVLSIITAYAAHLYPEKDYQNKWCAEHGGITEYRLSDKTRVDCLTETHAIEFDFAKKWAEAVGQSLYYALKTGKHPGIVLIIEKPSDARHLLKLTPLSEELGITIWIIHPEDINSF